MYSTNSNFSRLKAAKWVLVYLALYLVTCGNKVLRDDKITNSPTSHALFFKNVKTNRKAKARLWFSKLISKSKLEFGHEKSSSSYNS